MNRPEEKVVANLEEVQPRKSSQWEEAPLIIFTLLGQLAVGGFWTMLWMFPSFWASVQFDVTITRLIPFLLIGVSLGIGLLVSFSHLGTKRNAWRMLLRLKKSWLSREILFALLFGLGWLYITVEMILLGRISPEAAGITAALGLGLVYSMAQVYRLASMPRWNTWRTNVGFVVSAFLLGISVMSSLLAYESEMAGIYSVIRIISSGLMLFLLLAQFTLMSDKHSGAAKLRIGAILLGILFTVVGIFQPLNMAWLVIPICIFVLAEEGLGRWLFYKNRT